MTYVRVPVATVDCEDPYDEAETLKAELPEEHHVVVVQPLERVEIVELHDIGDIDFGWLPIATFDGDSYESAEHLAEAMESDEYRVVSDYVDDEEYVERALD